MQIATIAEKKSILTDLLGAEDKFHSFSTYFNVYDSLTAAQYSTIQIRPPALNSHEDIRRLALALRANPQITRNDFIEKAFPQNFGDPEIVVDQEHAVNVAVQIMLMIDCSDKDRHCDDYEIDGFRPVRWDGPERLVDFVRKVFPNGVHDQKKVGMAIKEKNSLKCWKLRKRAHVKFLPTDNLAEHLLYDPQDSVVRIFRQTAFLKAHLRLSANMPLNYGITESLQMGTLPPQLLLETLHSLQCILFPPIDRKSSQFLVDLVQNITPKFDPDCLLYEGCIRPVPEDFKYYYWGNRIAKLHHVIKNPRPRNFVGLWIQRHASERNALIVAILSLVLSALFGFLSVILGLSQAWFAYKSLQAQLKIPPGSNFT